MLHQATVPAAGGTKLRITANDKVFEYIVPAGLDRVNIGIEAISMTTELKPDGSRLVEEPAPKAGSDGGEASPKGEGSKDVHVQTLSPDGTRVHNAAVAGLQDAKDSKPSDVNTKAAPTTDVSETSKD